VLYGWDDSGDLSTGYVDNFSDEEAEARDLFRKNDPVAFEIEAAKLSKCRYCDDDLNPINFTCKSCGKGSLKECNKCGGEISTFGSKCKKCKKSIYECAYCEGKMKMDVNVTDLVCQSCKRVRKY
jgi:primosomal protein N'